MALFNAVRELFTQKKTIEQIDAEELRRERIKLEQNENRMMREIEQVEQQKEEFFRKGVEGGAQRQKLQIARKIKELDARVKSKDKQLALISRNLRVLSGLAQIKDNQKLLTDLGVSGLLNNMDLDQIQEYVERATVEGQFQMERFAGLLDVLDSGDDLDALNAEDADTQAILEVMQLAGQSDSETAISDGMKQVDDALRTHDSAQEMFS